MSVGEKSGEGLGLEFLEKLTLYDNEFEYRNKTYNYKDIHHVEFTAVVTKHSVNFIPAGTSYDANLFLHLSSGQRLHIKQERTFWNRNEQERSEAIMQAAGIFMDISFNQRVEAYEQQMEDKGFVVWGKHQIGRNGDLFRKNELRFNILNDDISCRLGPFQAECSKRKPGIGDKLKELWSGPAEVIDISTDKDCFLYIMKRYLNLSWQNQPVREKRRSGNEVFKEGILILGAKLCKADGQVTSDEIAMFKQYFGIDESTYPGANKVFTEAAKTSSNAKEAAKRVSGLFEGDSGPLEYIIIGLMQIAAADGHFDESEKNFIRMVAQEFAFSPADINRLFQIHDQSSSSSRRDRGDSTGTHGTGSLVIHLEVLGLDENATFAEIKVAYRNLARKHHPDILRAQGVPIDDIMIAEEMLRVINSAYETLTLHHRKKAKAGSN